MEVGLWLWELRYARARAWVKADLLGGRKGSSPGRAMASDQDPTGVDARGETGYDVLLGQLSPPFPHTPPFVPRSLFPRSPVAD